MGSWQCEFGTSLLDSVNYLEQTPATLLAQAHANAGAPHTPHRERREREPHRRTSRQVQDNQTPSTPHVLSPSPAHVKSSGRRQGTQDRTNPRNDLSVQPLAPTNRRLSQQARDSTALNAPHPYATAPSANGYRSGAPGAYGRQSPLANGNGSTTNANGSESFLYGGPKIATNSRDGLSGTPREMNGNGARGMTVFDRDQMGTVGEQDEDGHGRKGGLWSVLCCRG